jgi:hypothetical protein
VVTETAKNNRFVVSCDDSESSRNKRQFNRTILLVVVVLAIVGTCYDVRKHNREKNLIMGHRGNITGKQCATNGTRTSQVQ